MPTLASSEDKGRTWKRLPILLGGVVKPADEENATTFKGVAQPCSITFRSDGIALLTWIVDKIVYGAVFDSSWKPLWTGEISRKATGSEINVAPYLRRDVRLDAGGYPGGPNADMDISLQFGFTNYGECDAAVRADDSFIIIWREDNGQLYSRSIRLPSPTIPILLTVMPDTDITALVRYSGSNITFDENTNTFEYDLDLVNASDTPLTGPFLFKITNVASTIGEVQLKSIPDDAIVFASPRSAILLPGEHTLTVHVRIQASSQALEKITSPSTNLARVGIIGRVYASTASASR